METLKNVGTVIITVKTEWPEEDRQELQKKLDEYAAALDAANEKADRLMEKMRQMQKIILRYSEAQT